MPRTRIIIIAVTASIITLLYFLPSVVVENENQLGQRTSDGVVSNPHTVPDSLQREIRRFRTQIDTNSGKEKSAIFADSLSDVYADAGKFDSAAHFAEISASFFNSLESWNKAGDYAYQAFTFALNQQEQSALAEKAQHYFGMVLEKQPGNLEVKSKLAMTYVSGADPMKGIMLLRDVLEAEPTNAFALYNMGMLSFQSGQYARAIERLEKLVSLYPDHVQGQLLLGIAYKNNRETDRARAQLEKVKEMDDDPAVAATVDSYLEELK